MPRTSRLIAGVFGCLLLVLPAPEATAQTMEQALVAAYQGNPTLLAQRAALRATDEGVSQAVSGWRPVLSASASIGKNSVDSSSGFFTSDETRTPETYSLTLTQPVYRGGRTVASTAQAEHLVLADRARLAEIEQQVFLDAVTAYMDVMRGRAVLDLALNNEARLERQLEAARDRFEVGEVTRTDVAQAESRLSNAAADRISVQGNLIVARAAFQNVIGAMPVRLAPPPLVGGLPAAEADARNIAIAEHPSIRRAAEAERAAQEEVDVVTGGLLPEVNVDAELSRADDQASRGSVNEQAKILARVTVPLYQSGSVYSKVREARERVSQRRVEVEESRRAVLENVTQWWEALRTSRARIVAYSESVRAAEIALEGVEQEAEVGSRTTLDVLDAEQELFDVKVDLVRARRDEVVAVFGLRAAIGRLTAQSLGLPVQIYDPSLHYDAVRNQLWGTMPND